MMAAAIPPKDSNPAPLSLSDDVARVFDRIQHERELDPHMQDRLMELLRDLAAVLASAPAKKPRKPGK